MLSRLRRFRLLVAAQLQRRPYAPRSEARHVVPAGADDSAVNSEGGNDGSSNNNASSSSSRFDGGITDDDMLSQLASLVSLEHETFAQREVFAKADVEVRDHPKLLVNRAVGHFQQLFGVRYVVDGG